MDKDRSVVGVDAVVMSAEAVQERRWGSWGPAALILVTEMMERLCFYTFNSTQSFFLQKRGYGSAQSTSINSAFTIVSYIWPLAGGWLADSKLGKFRVILLGCMTYCLGTYLTAASSIPESNLLPLYFIGTFGLVAAGTGAIKPCVAAMGSDQFDATTPKGARAQESFFNWFFATINFGALLALAFLTSIATNGTSLIPVEWGFVAVYTIAATAMTVALVAFWCGSSLYCKVAPGGDVYAGFCWYISRSARESWQGAASLAGWIMTFVALIMTVISVFMPETPGIGYIAVSLALLGNGLLVTCHLNNNHLDGVEESIFLSRKDAKGALDCVPILIVVIVAANLMFNLQYSVFSAQACQMDLRLDSSTFGAKSDQISGGAFQVADTIAVVLFTPVVEWLLTPILRWCYSRHDTTGELSPGTFRVVRTVAGLLVAATAVLMAAAIEIHRRGTPLTGVASNCAAEGVQMSTLSSWAMVVPLATLGVAEALVVPGIYSFAYQQSPPSTRSTLTAFQLFLTGGVSSAYTAALTRAANSAAWFTNDLNAGRMELFYLCCVGFTLAGIPLFLYVNSVYVEKTWDAPVKQKQAEQGGVEEKTGRAKVGKAKGDCAPLPEESRGQSASATQRSGFGVIPAARRDEEQGGDSSSRR